MTQPGNQLRASVVIPTWNRRELLKEVLHSLAAQTLPRGQFDVIVVDDCSTDGTAEMVRQFAEQSPFRLTYHPLPRNVGAVPARNIAVRLTEAPVLAFTDSDCRVVPEWLDSGLRALDGNPEIAFVTGPVRNKPGQAVRFFSIGASGSSGEDPIYPTCNVLYRSKVFWSVGGFDERAYLRNSGGVPVECADADLAWRTKEAGHQNLFVPEMVVYHEVRQGTPLAWLAVQFRFIMVPELLRRHAGLRDRLMWWGPFCLPDNLLFYVALGALAMAAAFSPWWLLALLPFLWKMLRIAGGNVSLANFPKFPAQVAMLTVRQALICGALIYGSVRSRWLVL
jgi:glycosyltransferase involved in cell wall biosynthesis